MGGPLPSSPERTGPSMSGVHLSPQRHERGELGLPHASWPSTSPGSPQSPNSHARWTGNLQTSHSLSPRDQSSPVLGHRPLRRMLSNGSIGSSGVMQSPPTAGGNWGALQQHDNNMSALSNARISSPLGEAGITAPVEAPLPADPVDSVWPETDEMRPPGVLPQTGAEETGQPGLTVPRLSLLSLSETPGADAGVARTTATPRSSPLPIPGAVEERSASPQPGTPESPPKVRSHIALPPRSGYSLSDDSDSLRSEGEGSAGSGPSSVDSGSDPEEEEEGVDRSAQVRAWHERSSDAVHASGVRLPAHDTRTVDVDTEEDSDEEDAQDDEHTRVEAAAAVNAHSKHSRGARHERHADAEDDEDTSNDADAEDDNGEPPAGPEEQLEEVQPGIASAVSPADPANAEMPPPSHMSLPRAEESMPVLDAEAQDDGLSSLERIFLFAKSDMAFHRVQVSRCLAEWIHEVDLTDAVEYVIPLLNGLATDELEVSATFAPELGRIMWFFFRNCPLAGTDPPRMPEGDEEIIPRPRLAVGIFSPLLCALLLNPNSAVSGATQASIVEYFLRSKQMDEASSTDDQEPDTDLLTHGSAREGKLVPLEPYAFDRAARDAVVHELFENVALAISQLDTERRESDTSAGSTTVDEEAPINEEAALGRMMSVNLLAAITVEGGLQSALLEQRVVPELVRWTMDGAFFVRKEVAAAIGIVGKALVGQQMKTEDVSAGGASTTPSERTADVASEAQLPSAVCAVPPVLSSQPAPREPCPVAVAEQLATALDRVLQDAVWQVRQAACYSLPGVYATQPANEARRSRLLDVMHTLEQDVSANVQLAAFEMIGEIIFLFENDPAGVPEELVRVFLGQPLETHASPRASPPSSGFGMLAASAPGTSGINTILSDPDKALIVAFNFPAVALTLGGARWPVLRELYLQLTQHAFENVRNSLAASLHELAKLLDRETVQADLVPVAERFLRDPCTDVTATLLEHIDVFWGALPLEVAREQLRQLPMLWFSHLTRDWRLRQRVALHMESLAPSLLLADEDGCLVTLLHLALNDPVHLVRQVGVQAVPTMYDTFRQHDPAIADGFLSMLCDHSGAASFRQRVIFLNVVGALLDHHVLARDRFERFILPRFAELVTDPVFEVRLALARVTRTVWFCTDLYPSPDDRPALLAQLLAKISSSPSRELHECVQDLVPHSDRARLGGALPTPRHEPRTLEFGPAPSLLDTAALAARREDSESEDGESPGAPGDAPAVRPMRTAEPFSMDEDET